MKKVINNHNAKILKNEEVRLPCNCRVKRDCPMNGQCRLENIIYQATVIPTNQLLNVETYIGMTSPIFKKRFSNHTKSFNHRKYSNETELSKHVWHLKDQNEPFTINWRIVDRARPFSPISRKCSLCTLEKFFYILYHPEKASLNKREEIFNSCRHKNSLLLDKI